MKRLLAILFAAATLAVAYGDPPPPLTAAVLDFQVSGKDFEKKGAEAAVLLNAKLSAAPSLILVERQEIDKILGEQELGLSGNVTPDTAAKVGQLTGAKVLITGRLFGADNKYFAVAKIISTETGRVYGETATFASPDAVEAAANELTPKIIAVIEKRGDTLVAKVEDPAARIERLKKLVEGKKLPSVSVQIAEQHLGRAVIDPATQTEMKLALQKLGFEVIDSASGKQPDVAISGEAFSEMAGRRANLISCRSRVEIKVSQPATGKLLLADRQTDVAVDLAEHIAGKTALENAALKLMDRVVPVLTAAANP
ncbi:MAG: CsgG/HfaB family protein [Chthoniobacteraceae bacterium]|nr:CsgG/HfaB family protein [Chthoniobacteraceae bacterium]